MSDSDSPATNTEDTTAVSLLAELQPRAHAPDWFLQQLVRIASTTPLSLDVTLFVGGMMISGDVISASTYFAELGDQVKQSMEAAGHDEGLTETVTSLFTQNADLSRFNPSSDDESEDDHPLETPAYIHLRVSTALSPNGTITFRNGVVWRGRIASIDAVTLGKWSP